MSGPKRNPDKLNTIGVVVVGICGAVLVYVTIVALQAFYMDDTSEIQMMADYGGQDTAARKVRSDQMTSLTSPSQPNPRGAGAPQTFRIPLKAAMQKVLEDAKQGKTDQLVPIHGKSDKATVLPIYGRPQPIQPPAGAGSGAQPPATDAPATDAPATEPVKTPTGGEGMGGRTPPVDTLESGQAPVTNLPKPGTLPETKRPRTNPGGGGQTPRPQPKGNAQ
jgi:hypothetical protein